MELNVKLNAKQIFLMCSVLLLNVSCNENVAFQKVSTKKSSLISAPDAAKDAPAEVATTTTTSPIPADPNGTCGRVSNLEMCAQTTGCQPLLEEDTSGVSTIIGCIAVANAPVVVVAKAPVVEVVKVPEVVATPAAAPVVVVAKAPVVEVVKTPAVATVVVKTPVVSTAVSLSETKYSTNNEREDEDEDDDKDKDNSKSTTCTKAPRMKIPQTCNSIAAQFKINHNREIKVVICHHSDKKAETIAIACPALSAHMSHGEDVLGACVKEELASVKK